MTRSRKYRVITALERVNNRLTRYYVRNLRANPRVRVKVGGVWRTGTATVLDADDPVARGRTLPYRWDAAIGRAMATTPLTVRIDLDSP